jgi:hypothetical protein
MKLQEKMVMMAIFGLPQLEKSAKANSEILMEIFFKI